MQSAKLKVQNGQCGDRLKAELRRGASLGEQLGFERGIPMCRDKTLREV